MPDLKCGRCPATAERKRVTDKLVIDPPGWTVVTVSGMPMHNVVLCPPCTDDVVTVLKAELTAVTGRHAAVSA